MAPHLRTPLKLASKKRQTTLNFAPSSSPARRSSLFASGDTQKNPEPAPAPLEISPKTQNTDFEIVIPMQLSAQVPAGDTSDDDDDEPVQSSSKRRRTSTQPAVEDKRGKELAEDSERDFTPQAQRRRQESIGDDEEEDIVSPATKRKRLSRSATFGGQSWRLLKEDSTPVESEDSLKSLPETASGRSDSDDLEIVPSSITIGDSESDMDSEYELALQTPTVKTKTRYAGSSSKRHTSREKMLAALKAQRERRDKGSLSSPLPLQPDASHDADEEADKGDSGEEESNMDYLNGDLDVDLKDFVIEDTANDLLGAPDDEVPLEFTSASHAPNNIQFEIYAKFLICYTLFPSMARKGIEVTNAIRRLETKVTGLNESVINSGAWKPDFVRAMKARPKMEVFSCTSTNHCDACNRNNQHCRDKVQFTGRRYDHDTLDDVDTDEDEETQDSNGELLACEDAEFTLGSSCFRRTKSAHVLSHWKKELKNFMEVALVRAGVIDEEGHILDDKVANYSDKEKGEWLEGVCDDMGYSIMQLYNDFKITIKTARESMASKYFRSNAQRPSM